MSKNEDEDAWFQRTWTEREERLWQLYGPSQPAGSPAGHVLALPAEVRLERPGSCVYVFPPCGGAERTPRASWVYVSHGLTQPLEPCDEVDRSGDGWEFAVETASAGDWAPLALQLFVEEVIAGAEFDVGHRVAGFFARHAGALIPFLGTPDMHQADPVGPLRWWLLFPHLRPWTELTCETGRFALLGAVGLCDDEFALLEDVNRCGYHLQLLLCERGVGQRTDPLRPSVLSEPEGRSAWERIRRLSAPEAWGEVVARFSLPEGPTGS